MAIASASLPKMGVIMLNTAFPRPVGDIGNAATFRGNVVYEVVEAATVSRVMGGMGQDETLAGGFLAARDRLIEQGAQIVTTSCGVLVFYQDDLAKGCGTPIVASSLFQVARRRKEFAGPVGILVMDSRSLTPAHLEAAGCPPDSPVAGLENGTELHRVLKANSPAVPLDPEHAKQDVIAAARHILEEAPQTAAFVMECTNLPPYRAALEQALGLPVFDILTWLEEIWRDEQVRRT